MAPSLSKKRQSGFSLLEMVMAAALVAGCLVPSMAVMREAMAKSRDLTRRNLLATYAVSLLEAQQAATMLDWTSNNSNGDFATDGYPSIRYTASRSDSPADGGISGQLMHIEVMVFDDTNGDTTPSADEVRATFRTKIARLTSYENEE